MWGAIHCGGRTRIKATTALPTLIGEVAAFVAGRFVGVSAGIATVTGVIVNEHADYELSKKP